MSTVTRIAPAERLRSGVTAANTQYVLNAERLAAKFAGQTLCPVDAGSVLLWSSEITHELSTRMRGGTNALSYRGQNLIRYNERIVETTTDTDLHDLILHELGHQWCDRFLGPGHGHDQMWQWVGWIVGYVPVGSTTVRRRDAYARQMIVHRTFAAAGRFNPMLGV